jgi:hypothetical protein
MHCPQCGWPGLGTRPAGVRLATQNGKSVLVGQLTYFFTQAVLCSVCEELMSAVAARSWFVEAHREYLDQVKAKKRILGGK